jgi:hypothetical protein
MILVRVGADLSLSAVAWGNRFRVSCFGFRVSGCFGFCVLEFYLVLGTYFPSHLRGIVCSTLQLYFLLMYSAKDKSHQRARAIKKGEYKLNPAHQQFVDWASDLLGTKVLDFELETKETSKGYKQQIVAIIVERIADEERLEKDYGKQQVIAQRYITYLSSTPEIVRRTDPLKKDAWPITINPYPEILVFFYPLERVEKSIAETNIKADWEKTLTTFPEFWTLSQDVIFLHTNEQCANRASSGLEAKLTEAYLKLIKRYDEFGYLGVHSISFRFDTKESFDKNYDGNWYYYWK